MDIIKAFAKEAIRDEPVDLIEYSYLYFKALENGEALKYEGPKRAVLSPNSNLGGTLNHNESREVLNRALSNGSVRQEAKKQYKFRDYYKASMQFLVHEIFFYLDTAFQHKWFAEKHKEVLHASLMEYIAFAIDYSMQAQEDKVDDDDK